MANSIPFIHALPPHILSKIFLFCLPERVTRYLQYATPLLPDEAPLLLCKVNRFWRRLACITPALWASIIVSVDHSTCRVAPPIEVVASWLERSKDRALDLSLYLTVGVTGSTDDESTITPGSVTDSNAESADHNPDTGVAYDGEATTSINNVASVYTDRLQRGRPAGQALRLQEAVDQVMYTFLQHSERWRRLELRVPDIPFPHSIFLLYLRKAQMLEEVYLDLNTEGSRHFNLGLRAFSSCRHLIKLGWFSQSMRPLYSSIPWWQLVDVEMMSGVTISEILVVLKMTRNLESLIVRIAVPKDAPLTLMTEIDLPRLTRLWLYGNFKHNDFFGYLITPWLIDLSVFQDEHAPTWSNEPLSDLSTRSQSRLMLTELNLTNTDLSDKQLASLLHQFPNISHLTISNATGHATVTDRLLKLLRVHHPKPGSERPERRNPILATKLSYLRLSCCISAEDGLLASLVQSRWFRVRGVRKSIPIHSRTGVFRLQTVVIELPSEQMKSHSSDIEKLQKMSEEGLQIIFTNKGEDREMIEFSLVISRD